MTSVKTTFVTRTAIRAMTLVILASAGFLMAHYASLPWLLPVAFKANGIPSGWQYRTPVRVLLPVFVQLALAVTLGGIGALLLSRPHAADEPNAPDVRAAAVAAEAVILIALIWVAFQAYAAWALVGMWTTERAGLGVVYTYMEITGAVLSAVVFVRANIRLGRPMARPFVAEHWRFGQLYNNAADPALFVPTRDGRRWTLNFGRPVTAALLGVIIVLGIIGPTVILAVLLRGSNSY